MGQSISRRVVPRLNNAFQKYENAATKDALDDMAQRQALARSGKTGGYSDPNAVHGGFRRENAPALPQEAAQEEFLRSRQPQSLAGNGQEQEMPEDLLKFLNDNPLEKTVDRDLTSPKVLDSLLVEEEQQQGRAGSNKEQADGASASAAAKKRTPRTRTRRTMPLAESMVEDLPDDVSADIAGATGVVRTTNFSTADLDGGASDADSDEAKLDRLLRLTDRDLASLLRRDGATLASSDAGGAADADAGAADDNTKQKHVAAAETFLTDRLSTSDIASVETLLSSEKRATYISLMANALRYSGMPVLLKDEVDADYVGVWPDRVKELERMKLRVVKEEETTLLFEGRAGNTSSSDGDDTTAEVSTIGSAHTSTDAELTESNIREPPPQVDSAVAKSTSSAGEKEDDNWKRQYMEETKKLKGKVGSTGPATRKFLEEEAARVAAAAAAKTEPGEKVAKKAE